MVTLCGPPGVGKTRLALEAATAAVDSFPDGAWWVDLATVREPEGIVAQVARATGTHDQPGRPASGAVVDWLAGKSALLVLDNCEHLLESARNAAQLLLEGCRDLHVVATSREPLGLSGEQRVEVAPMTVPAGVDVEAVASSEAGQLFCSRASAVHPVFELGAPEAAAIAEICARLDGIPLAIELAAGRVGVLSPTEIAHRLSDRFSLLGGVARSFNSRHRTLAEALDWSYELLSPPEQALLRRLAIFSGDFTFEAAEAVCSGGDVGPAALLDHLASLVAKSLVVARTSPPPARYRLLETVRVYAGERLGATAEADDVADRHTHWYGRLAEAAEDELTGPNQVAWLHLLDAEYPNLVGALERSLTRNQSEDSLRLAGSLILYWRLRGRFREGRRWLGAALQQSDDALQALRTKALWGCGFMLLMSNELVLCEKALAESLDLYREIDDIQGQARVLLLIGNHHLDTLGPTAAQDPLEQSITLARQANDHWCLAHALTLAGRARIGRGDVEVGRRMLEEALVVAGRAGDDQGCRIAQVALGQLAVSLGEPQRARSLLESSLTISAALGDPYGVGAALLSLGELATVDGNYDRAWVVLHESLELSRRIGSSPAPELSAMASTALLQGDLERARQVLDQLEQQVSSSPMTLLLGLAELALAEEHLDIARQHLDHDLVGKEVSARTFGGARALHDRGCLSRAEGDPGSSEARHSEALAVRNELGDMSGIAQSLEAVASLAADAGDGERAARLFGAADSVRSAGGFARPPSEQAATAAGLAAVEASLAPEDFDVAWRQGQALTATEAAAYALRGRGRRATRPGGGWESLTPAEREVAHLVGEGLNNAQIAERRFVNPDTVKKHVKSSFAKLGIASRVDLAKEALRHQR